MEKGCPSIRNGVLILGQKGVHRKRGSPPPEEGFPSFGERVSMLGVLKEGGWVTVSASPLPLPLAAWNGKPKALGGDLGFGIRQTLKHWTPLCGRPGLAFPLPI